jgi:hypothetical protein
VNGGSESQVRKADTVSAAVLVLAGLYLAVRASDLPFGSLRSPGPGFFPFSLSVLLVALAGLLLVRSRFGVRDASVARLGPEISSVLFAVIAMVVYALTLERIGFPILTCLLMFFLLRVLGRTGWIASIALAVAGTAFVFFLFRQLGAQLPLGPFFM